MPRFKPKTFVLRSGKFSGRTLAECPLEYVMYLATETGRCREAREATKFLRRKWGRQRERQHG